MLPSQRWKSLWHAGPLQTIPRCLLVQLEEHCSVICQRASKKNGRRTRAIHKQGVAVLFSIFLVHSQDTSGRSNTPSSPGWQRARSLAPLIRGHLGRAGRHVEPLLAQSTVALLRLVGSLRGQIARAGGSFSSRSMIG